MLEAVASIVIVGTLQVRIAGVWNPVIGIFTSAETLTEEIAVQPFTVLVTNKLYVPTAPAVVLAVVVLPEMVPSGVVHKYVKFGPELLPEPLSGTVFMVQVN